MKPHWYEQFVYSCPVCGKETSYRERRYGDRALGAVTHNFITQYDYCYG